MGGTSLDGGQGQCRRVAQEESVPRAGGSVGERSPSRDGSRRGRGRRRRGAHAESVRAGRLERAGARSAEWACDVGGLHKLVDGNGFVNEWMWSVRMRVMGQTH
jgi:hypothetical protein